jgi:uncharacterized protein
MTQSWRNQLFAHWRVSEDVLRPLIPEPLVLDQFDGQAFVGLTPFRLSDLQIGPLPPLPVASDFLEVNVRTYVRYGGKSGVFFFSLDASSQVAVLGARFTFDLPYFHADMQLSRASAEWFEYRSRRLGDVRAELAVRYRPNGSVFNAVPGTLDYFLIERYALFTVPDPQRVMCVDIHHAPWNLQAAFAEFTSNTMAAAANIPLPPEPPLLHYADRQDAMIWAPESQG